jgi:hypothetical protein
MFSINQIVIIRNEEKGLIKSLASSNDMEYMVETINDFLHPEEEDLELYSGINLGDSVKAKDCEHEKYNDVGCVEEIDIDDHLDEFIYYVKFETSYKSYKFVESELVKTSFFQKKEKKKNHFRFFNNKKQTTLIMEKATEINVFSPNANADNIAEIYQEELNKCSQIIIDGTTFFGKIKRNESNVVTSVNDCILPSSSDLKETVKEYIRGINSGSLNTIEVGGTSTIVVSSFTAKQRMEIKMVVLTAAVNVASAVPELLNRKI